MKKLNSETKEELLKLIDDLSALVEELYEASDRIVNMANKSNLSHTKYMEHQAKCEVLTKVQGYLNSKADEFKIWD